MSTHQFTIDADGLFPNKKVDLPRFEKEIRESSAIVVALDSISIVERNCVVVFKAALSEPELDALEALVQAHTGVALLPPIQAVELWTDTAKVPTNLGIPTFSLTKSTGSSFNSYSHDWSKKQSWYSASTRVVNETLSDTGNHTTYDFANEYIIDSYHGLITQEDYLLDSNNHSFRVSLTVNDVAKTENDPHTAAGDYVINYVAGTVTFNAALAVNDVVKATYHYAQSSLLYIRPAAGKILIVEMAEVQFSSDMVMTDSVVYQPRGYVDVFAPQLVGTGEGQIPSGTKIPLGAPFVYKSMRDFYNDAFRSYPSYPPLGGNSWRGIQNPVTVFDWDYIQGKPLYSSYGMEIECKLQHDLPFGGEFSTVTFYCSSKDE